MSVPPVIIVDKNDQPIGQSTIGEARAKGLIVRLSRVMVESLAGDKVLLQKRRVNDQLYPGRWDNSAAGHVDVGEDYLTSAKRELYEEIGIKTNHLEKIGKYYAEANPDGLKLRQFNTVYRYKTDETPTEFPDGEVTAVEWFEVSELKKLVANNPQLFTNGVQEVIKRYY